MKKKLKIHAVIRFVIQLLFFIFYPALFSMAFMGVKYIAEQIYKREVISWNPFVMTMVIVLGVTVLLGRYFCGFACAFGSLGDWLFIVSSWIQKKFRKKVIQIPTAITAKLQYVKYLVLIGILITCFTGTYSKISVADPWTLFASFRSGNFSLQGHLYAAIVLGIIVIGMCFVERFFCQFLCPLGAIFALLPMTPFAMFTRNKEQCIKGCTLCVKTCPASISLGDKGSRYGDCFQCGKCSIKCPKSNIQIGIRRFMQK
jgi:polyferredoxin